MSKFRDAPSTLNCRRQLVEGVPEKVSLCLPSPSTEPPPPSSLSANPRRVLPTRRLPALTGGCLSDPAHFEMSQVFLLMAHVYSVALGKALWNRSFPHCIIIRRKLRQRKKRVEFMEFLKQSCCSTLEKH